MSSGEPILPSGVCISSSGRIFSSGAVIAVSIQPGAIALTRIWRVASSRASARVRPRMPAFAAL